jgi:hypothetical protein
MESIHLIKSFGFIIMVLEGFVSEGGGRGMGAEKNRALKKPPRRHVPSGRRKSDCLLGVDSSTLVARFV